MEIWKKGMGLNMNLIKRHKGLAIVGGLTLILLIIILMIFARMFLGSNNSSYGDRLNNIEKLDKSVNSEVVSKLKEVKEVSDISIRTQGKIIYITIKYLKGTKLAKAKEIANKTLEYYDDEIKKSYDFGYFLVEDINDDVEDDEEKSGFLVSGTKHPDNNEISWT